MPGNAAKLPQSGRANRGIETAPVQPAADPRQAPMTTQIRDIVALIAVASLAILSVVYADTDLGQLFAAVLGYFQ